jgi:alpha-N-arabinofuranosidase
MGRHVSAHGWDNGFINFDNKGWFAGPNYVVMKLWREHFAPNRVESTTPDTALNLIATKSQSGDQVILKAVNLSTDPLDVTTTLDGAFKPAKAAMQLVNPGNLQARNSMRAKDVIKPTDAPATLSGNTLQFTLPPYSVAALRLTQ